MAGARFKDYCRNAESLDLETIRRDISEWIIQGELFEQLDEVPKSTSQSSPMINSLYSMGIPLFTMQQWKVLSNFSTYFSKLESKLIVKQQ
jgi:hypothetical protein